MNIRFHPLLVVRTPALPLDTGFSKEKLEVLWKDARFREAIYLASPVLHNEAEKYFPPSPAEALRRLASQSFGRQKEERLFNSLAKYYSRMNSRCTPFGLFAFTSVINWGDETAIQVYEKPSRTTRLDMHFLCRLLKKLEGNTELREHLKYFPNSSIYNCGDQLRYVEVGYEKGKRIYHTASADNSEYISGLLSKSKNGLKFDDMIQYLIGYEVSITEAESFINELIDEQILVSELEPAITSTEAPISLSAEVAAMGELKNSLDSIKALDKNQHNDPDHYRRLIKELESFGIPIEENRVFQVDGVSAISNEGRLNKQIQEKLKYGIEFLYSVFPYRGNESLEKFKNEFKERYGQREMPLTTLMDAEIGIEYGVSRQKQESPLLENLNYSFKEKEISAGIHADDARWLPYLLKAQKENAFRIQLEEKDLEKLKVVPPGFEGSRFRGKGMTDDWAPSFPVSFHLAAGNKVWLEYAGGTSAINLLSRFAHADEKLEALTKEIAAIEQERNPDVILAEIVHLPEERIGNIAQHPVIRDYEINYLAKPGVDTAHTISVDDLFVSVFNDRIILSSKRLNKEIIPRLSNAHNFGWKSLPLYHFLCDLQSQQIHLASRFSFGGLESYFNFLPRVEYKDCILHPATWSFSRMQYESLFAITNGQLKNHFSEFLKEWNIPDLFLLTDGDNELLVDTRNELMVSSFLKLIEKRSDSYRNSIRIREFILDDTDSIKDSDGNKFNAQFIALLLNENRVYNAVPDPVVEPNETLVRNFLPGSEWVYYKLYCGFTAADKVLQEFIGPLMNQWMKEKKIYKWFFIRYNDPQFHLRLRFQCADPALMIGEFGKLLLPLLDHFGIQKIQLDSYEREIERYGADAMELSESVFWLDSMSIIQFLQSLPDETRDAHRWLWGLKVMDDMLDDFQFSLQDKLNFVQTQRKIYSKEFNANDAIKKQIDGKWRESKSKAEAFLLTPKQTDFQQSVFDLLIARKKSLAPIFSELSSNQKPSTDFLSSHLHMMLNRLFPSNPREQEWILYEYLCRYYASVIARKSIDEKQKVVTGSEP